MPKENISQEFRMKSIDEPKSYLIKEINWNELMTKERKKVCITLNYIENPLILAPTITRCVSISSFASVVNILIGIPSSAIELKICATAAGIISISQ